MTRISLFAVAAMLASAPAMAQVVIQGPGPDPETMRNHQRAMQDRADARWQNQEAQRRAAMGDYEGAAQAQREARRDWHDARRQDEGSGYQPGYRPGYQQPGVVIGR